MAPAIGAEGTAPLLYIYFVMMIFLRFSILLLKDGFLSNSLRVCFCSLLIDARLVFIWYFLSVPLRKGHRGLEYQCSFVRLYLFLFAFLIICIETFGFSKIFCNKRNEELIMIVGDALKYSMIYSLT